MRDLRQLRERCDHMRYDEHPQAKYQHGEWCPGGVRVSIDVEAAVALLVDRLDVELITASVVVRDLVDALLVRGN